MAGPLDDLRRPLDRVAEEVARAAGGRIQAANGRSLAAGAGPGGPALAPNAPGYARRKGGKPIGVKTGGMKAALTDASTISMRIGGAEAEIVVPAANRGTVGRANLFIRGQPGGTRWRSEETPSGKRKAWKYEGRPVPARDFVGLAPADVEAIGEQAAEGILRAWGFR